MNNLAIKTQNNHFIKSWFGFFLSAIFVGLSLSVMLDNFTLDGILSTLVFLCFGYLLEPNDEMK